MSATASSATRSSAASSPRVLQRRRARIAPARAGAASTRARRPTARPRAAGRSPLACRARPATAHACSGPAPPNATSARSRASTPRSTVTTRTARSMAASTTATTPSAVTRSRSSARSCRRHVEPAEAGERGFGGDAREHEIGVGHRRLLAAAPVAGGAGDGARALGADDERAAGVESRDRAATGADRVDVERRQPDRISGDDPRRRRLGHAPAHEAHVRARAPHVERDRVGKAARRSRRPPPPARRRPARTAAAPPVARPRRPPARGRLRTSSRALRRANASSPSR